MYSFTPQNHLTCLSVVDDDVMLWHKRVGHFSLSLLNKLLSKDLIVGLPSIKNNNDNVYLVDSLQQIFLSVSQLYHRGNHVGFFPDQCLITNIKSGDIVLRGSDIRKCIKHVFFYFPQVI